MTHSSQPDDTNKSSVDPKKAGRELFRALFLCLLVVVVVRSNLFELFKIPSSSMVPTLAIGDHIVVSKFNYGLAVPLTGYTLFEWSSPKRGEVIVFIYPKDPSLFYIKRVVGVPGDTIEFKGKDLSINGEAVPKVRVEDPAEISKALSGKELKGFLYKETLGESTHYVKYSASAAYEFSRTGEKYVVGPDEFFVMGDNRDDSYDSRSWGNVPRANIRGKAQVIWLSVDTDSNWTSIEKYRWDRAFKKVD
jgi:signal peptidase I